jgi:hypothetical protein
MSGGVGNSIGAGGGVSQQQQPRRHTFLSMSGNRRGVASVVSTASDTNGVSRSTSVVLDPSGLGVVHQTPLRLCSGAKAVCWSVKAALAHPTTPQRLCPQPLRRKLYQKSGEYQRGGYHHNHVDLLESELNSASDEEVSSGDEEDFTSTEQDECIGKLAFGRRKLKLFDQITADNSDKARGMMKKYWREVYKSRFKAKVKHLQEHLTPQISGESGGGGCELDATLCAFEQELGMGEVDNAQLTNHPDSNAIRAALIIESLSINPHESIEGMADCYDGLVAAGAALIEHEEQKNRSITADGNKRDETKGETATGGDSHSNSDPRSVLSTLTPLLITTLEPLPGEAILQLSKLYNMCATVRYKRRFVHRVAPLLVRPSNSAVWCVKHQNDMAAIITVSDFLMENAKDIFSPQWVERGRFLKADGLRAENLRLAALQLKNLNKKETVLQNIANKAGGGLVSIPSQDGETGLAEWEVLAVDRYIRSSIRFVFERQWTSPKMTKHHAPSGRILHHSSTITAPSSVTVTSTGAGGCPMSPRKIPLSPSTYVNPNSASSSVMPQYMIEVPGSSSSMCLSMSPAAGSSGLPPPFSSAMITGVSDTTSAPLTPKPSNQATSINISNVGTPPRSPSSPPKTARTFNSDPAALGLNPPNLINAIHTGGTSSAPLLQPSVKRSAGPVMHYTLTKSAEERKRTVAACRALRAQINRFEEAFLQIHNRHPKGAAERAPLATTYAQYREWKRAIRADAATRIQALFRGALCRWTMLRSNSPRLTQLVRRSSRRSVEGGHPTKQQLNMALEFGSGENSMVSRGNLGGLPPSAGGIEIDNKSVASGNTYGMDVEERTCVSTEGVELIINTAGRRSRSSHRGGTQNNASPPQGGSASSAGWNLGRSFRGSKHKESDGGGGGVRAHLLSPKPLDGFSANPGATGDTRDSFGGVRGSHGGTVGLSLINPKKTIKYPKMNSSGNSVGSGSDSEASHSSRGSRGSYSGSSQTYNLSDMSLAELMVQKRELKAQLKTYDLNFAKQKGRMPVKAEKEPIRGLYEKYNALKAHISMLESGGGVSQSGSTASSIGASTLSQTQLRHSMGGSMPGRRGGNGPVYGSSDRSVDSAGSEDSFGRQINAELIQKTRGRSSSSGSMASGSINIDLSGGLLTSDSKGGGSSGSAPLPTDLRALKEEKGTLHQMLRSYEKDFFKEHNRQVSSFADIKPVASQYRRYKDIKKAIAAQQAAERS